MAKNRTDKYPPVTRVLVSSKVGENSALEQYNKEAIFDLHKHFRELVNSNGEVAFSLTNLEQNIVKAADAFVFLPIPKSIRHLQANHAHELFREMFKAASLIVGKQTNDPNLRLDPHDEHSPQKPIVLVNHEGCWTPFIDMMENLHRLGTVTQSPSSLFHVVDRADHVEIGRAHV